MASRYALRNVDHVLKQLYRAAGFAMLVVTHATELVLYLLA